MSHWKRMWWPWMCWYCLLWMIFGHSLYEVGRILSNYRAGRHETNLAMLQTALTGWDTGGNMIIGRRVLWFLARKVSVTPNLFCVLTALFVSSVHSVSIPHVESCILWLSWTENFPRRWKSLWCRANEGKSFSSAGFNAELLLFGSYHTRGFCISKMIYNIKKGSFISRLSKVVSWDR